VQLYHIICILSTTFCHLLEMRLMLSESFKYYLWTLSVCQVLKKKRLKYSKQILEKLLSFLCIQLLKPPIVLWHMGLFYNNRGMSINILVATNIVNSRRIAISMTTVGNPLLWDTCCDWLLGYTTILNGRGFLCGPCSGYVTRAVSCRIVRRRSRIPPPWPCES
jgi:hypothetical protein